MRIAVAVQVCLDSGPVRKWERARAADRRAKWSSSDQVLDIVGRIRSRPSEVVLLNRVIHGPVVVDVDHVTVTKRAATDRYQG